LTALACNDIRVNSAVRRAICRDRAIFTAEFRFRVIAAPAVSRRETVKGTDRMRRKFAVALAILTMLGAAPLLSACYTAQGAGKDVQAAGHGISHEAGEHTPYKP
jgi:predicted small secreted protein